MYIEDISVVVPPVGGWLEVKLGNLSIDRLTTYIAEAEEEGVSKRYDLAGNISKEYKMWDTDGWFLHNVVLPAIEEYEQALPSRAARVPSNDFKPFKLDNMWVNYQNKYEFNPLHDHLGVYSFVIWMRIPTHWKDEHDLPFVKGSNFPSSSNFSFSYTGLTGEIKSYPYYLDESLEGTMLLFPSELFHQVYPFYTSDEARISISGNIKV